MSQINAFRESISLGRVPHAQLFVGPEGVGMLGVAIAFMRSVFCQDSDSSACDLKFDRLTHADLHFVFPVASNAKVKSKPTSALFLRKIGECLSKKPQQELFLIGISRSRLKTNRVKLVCWMPKKSQKTVFKII